jgi:hypothetical protein
VLLLCTLTVDHCGQGNKTNLASTVILEQEDLCMKWVKVGTDKAAADAGSYY